MSLTVKKDINKLQNISSEVRKLIIKIANKSKSAHVGSSLSCVDLLVSVYFGFLNISLEDSKNRDIFILSKAHAAMALYSVLTLKGFLSEEQLMGYLQKDGSLPAHLDRFTNKYIEASAGSLGHGFNIALGVAHGYKLKGDHRKVVTLIGDGESQEGSIWEGAMFAPKLGLDNFTAIMDYNKLQGYGSPDNISCFEPLVKKWEAFGWQVHRINGHVFSEITGALNKPHKRPKIIIADTIKGKGVDFMENELKWHYFTVTDELRDKAIKHIKGAS